MKSHKPHLKFTIDHTWNAEANAFQICLPVVVLTSFVPVKQLNELLLRRAFKSRLGLQRKQHKRFIRTFSRLQAESIKVQMQV